MAHNAPSASDKEKTARLIASLSGKEQAELLAQALLREFMHRRGLHETLKAFDEENPRDERTISSRALMRQLLNIPVDGRPSRLQPVVSASTGKPMPPTFMEELCSYRLTKRGYTHPAIKIGDEHAESDEDPSDVELRSLHAAVDAHRTAKAACEQKQRRYEDMLAEDEAYQRRKEAHKLKKKKNKSKSKSQHRKAKQRDSGTSHGSSASDSDENGVDDDDDDENFGGSGVGSGLVSGIVRRRLSNSLSLTPDHGAGRRRSSSADTSLIGVPSTGWQPPGLTSIGSNTTATAAASSAEKHDGHRAEHLSSVPGKSKEDEEGGGEDDDSFDPFGSAANSQQALMARVRAESRHWAAANNANETGSNLTTPKKGTDGGATQPSPLAALTNVPRGLALAASDPLTLRPTLGGGGGGGGGGLGALSGIPGGSRLSSAPAGYNPNAVLGPAALPPPDGAGSREGSLSVDGPPASLTPYRNGFPPPPPSAMNNSSILVKHTDGARRDTASASPTPTIVVGDGPAAATHAYDRAAMPRGSAMTNSGGGGGGGRGASSGPDTRSPSPSASAFAGEDASAASLHTPSRAASTNNNGGNNSSSGGGGSGLRHGIGFRTSVSAEAAHAGAGGGSAAAGGEGESGGRPSRKERRVKLIIDD